MYYDLSNLCFMTDPFQRKTFLEIARHLKRLREKLRYEETQEYATDHSIVISDLLDNYIEQKNHSDEASAEATDNLQSLQQSPDSGLSITRVESCTVFEYVEPSIINQYPEQCLENIYLLPPFGSNETVSLS